MRAAAPEPELQPEPRYEPEAFRAVLEREMEDALRVDRDSLDVEIEPIGYVVRIRCAGVRDQTMHVLTDRYDDPDDVVERALSAIHPELLPKGPKKPKDHA